MRAIHATMPGEHLAIDLAVGLEPSNRDDVHILIVVITVHNQNHHYPTCHSIGKGCNSPDSLIAACDCEY